MAAFRRLRTALSRRRRREPSQTPDLSAYDVWCLAQLMRQALVLSEVFPLDADTLAEMREATERYEDRAVALAMAELLPQEHGHG